MTASTNRLGLRALLAGAAALAGGAALAQDFCGGVSANGQWIGGDEAASDIAASPDYLEQVALILAANEHVALFSVSTPTDVRIEAAPRGTGDPLIDLRDEAGTIILSDDDSGGGGAARAETTLEPGRYCLSMASFDGSPMTGLVRVGRTEHAALTEGLGVTEPVDPIDPMDPLPFDPYAGGVCDMTQVSRYLGGGGPVDALLTAGGATDTASVDEVPFWGFTLSAPQTITVTAQNADADPVITLYDEFGGYLAENDDFDGLDSRIDMTYPLQPGSYCIAMSALNDPALPITVTVTAYDAQASAVGMYDRAEAAPPLDGSYPVTALGVLGNRLRQDVQSTDLATWYSFEVQEGGLILVEAVTNGMGDPTLTLFDDFGRQVAYNDDNGDTLDSLVTARILPGTYLVAVRQLGAGTQALTRMLFERYVPAP